MRRPVRSCIGCGRKAPKAELLRFAVGGRSGRGGAVVVADPAGRLPGRGAYLCRQGERPKPSCLARALRRGAFGRTLRTRVESLTEAVESSFGG